MTYPDVLRRTRRGRLIYGGAGLLAPLFRMPLIDDLSIPIGTGPATFTRTTTKTFRDPNDGLIKTAAINEAAFEQNGVLIEGASTNLLLRSEEFDNAAWLKLAAGSGSAPIVTANHGISPDGSANADRIQLDRGTTDLGENANSSRLFQSFTSVPTGSGSVWVKTNTPGVQYTFGLKVFGTLTTHSTTDDWVRIDNANIANPSNYQIGLYGGNGHSQTADILIWGAQFEALPFASSYIPTTSATVTRAADNLSVDAANIPAPTADYSVSAEVDLLGLSGSSREWYNVAGEGFRIGRANRTTGQCSMIHGGGAQEIAGAVISGSEKIANVFGGGSFSLYQSGVLQGSNSSFTSISGSATSLEVGSRLGGNYLFGHIKNLRIYDAALTAEQVGAL